MKPMHGHDCCCSRCLGAVLEGVILLVGRGATGPAVGALEAVRARVAAGARVEDTEAAQIREATGMEIAHLRQRLARLEGR